MESLNIAKQIAGLVKEIEILDSKVSSLSAFAGKLVNSRLGHVEMALEEFDFDNVPTLQFLPAPPDEFDNPNEPPRMIGYSKMFNGTGELNIYSVLIENDVAMSVIDTVIGKMKAQRQDKQNTLDGLLPGNKIYGYSLSAGQAQAIVPVTVNKKTQIVKSGLN